MAANNSTIMAKAWLAGTNDFQQRIPDPTISGVAQTAKALRDPMNGKFLNQFMDILVNRIGWTYVRSQEWKNPLAPFKGTMLTYGSTIQEIIPKWVKAHSYEDDSQDLLTVNRPQAEVLYHTVNREDQYPISVNQEELTMAFTDDMGLNKLIAGIMQVPTNSDQYDEYKLMLELLAYYEKNWGFYKWHVDAPTDRATATAMLKSIRSAGGQLRFPSTRYVGISVPVFANPDDLVLLVTPDVQASLDVDGLAQLFNIDRAEVPNRIVLVDEFPIEGAQALLTSKDFFVVHDKLYSNTSFYNPQNLTTNYWLTHWEVVSCTPAVPAVLFTTDDSTKARVITQDVNGLNLKAADNATTVKNGGSVHLIADLTGTIDGKEVGEDVEVRPSACTWAVTAATADGKPVQLNMRTRVDEFGILHVQKSGLSAGDVITVTATTAYLNPSVASDQAKQDLSATISLTVA